MTSNPRVLLADDAEDDLVFLQRAFRKAALPYPLEIVRDGVEAIERLSAAGPPITHALLDLKMPRKNGFEVLEWLRSRPATGLRTAVLTSSRMNEDVTRAYALGRTSTWSSRRRRATSPCWPRRPEPG